jgi:hypothetical protein
LKVELRVVRVDDCAVFVAQSTVKKLPLGRPRKKTSLRNFAPDLPSWLGFRPEK